MKNVKILLFLFVSFISTNFVNADTFSLSSYSDNYDNDVAFYLSHQNEINNLINMWEENLSMQYPYYSIRYSNSPFSIILRFSETPDMYFYNVTSSNNVITSAYLGLMDVYDNLIWYDGSTYDIHLNSPGGGSPFFYLQKWYDPGMPESNSLPLVNNGMRFKSTASWTSIEFQGFTSTTYNQTISTMFVNDGDILPSVESIYYGTYNPIDTNTYTEINLNSYSYVLLTLKSYTPIDSQYSTRIYTKGSLCSTPVYNYGMTEKKNYYSGYQVQSCTEYYTDFTPVNFYILPQDVSNHVVYYIKSSNTYVDNIIKVDSDIFDITYVTSSNENNPSVTIGGRDYPVIPYSQLTDTAIISSNEGYISGASCSLGDVNCYYEQTGINISDIFTHPLQTLQSVWGSISSMFVLIFAFYALLPPVLQTFMASAFMLAVVLGLIKIILG